jgi:hypothetical protein
LHDEIIKRSRIDNEGFPQDPHGPSVVFKRAVGYFTVTDPAAIAMDDLAHSLRVLCYVEVMTKAEFDRIEMCEREYCRWK